MEPLKVALVHKNSPRKVKRMVGEWSYDVPEFVVEHFPVDAQSQEAELCKEDFANFDLVFWEDHGAHVRWRGKPVVSLVYHCVDSTLSQDHYWRRCQDAQWADLILVDHDVLERFVYIGRPVCRFNHCVNDRLFRDYKLPRDIDVSFLCFTKNSRERAELERWLHNFCAQHDLAYQPAMKHNTSEQYAQALNRSKLTVNLPRNPQNRPHRVFDAMAARACLLTAPLPDVSGDDSSKGIHYVEWHDKKQLGKIILGMLANGSWQSIANAGYGFVRYRHTWAVRAKELREILRKELGL